MERSSRSASALILLMLVLVTTGFLFNIFSISCHLNLSLDSLQIQKFSYKIFVFNILICP
ncbi:hypothetical protein CXB51_000309 [Gossypium anomalum]|uniref:Uncharacterized protein n=1 Tax=Gossypium anomalum TaxID=47600 RepID=A0A8J6DEE2_9ROSI|nr:hypothetical protein CXB51_000309 [Gossypium anomalum]